MTFTAASAAAAHLADNPAVAQAVETVIATTPPATVKITDVAAPHYIIEKMTQPHGGTLGYVVAVEPGCAICVQQPCNGVLLQWFAVPNGEYKVIGKAAGRYKIPEAEIQKFIEAMKPKEKKFEEWDAPR